MNATTAAPALLIAMAVAACAPASHERPFAAPPGQTRARVVTEKGAAPAGDERTDLWNLPPVRRVEHEWLHSPSLPEPRNGICGDEAIMADDGQVLVERLGDEEPIEWVAMQRR